MTELDGNIEILKMPKFVEGPWIHKRENLYYLTYASMGKGRETISYATAPSMEGPWTYRGVLTGMAENSFTIHPGIIEFKGQNYLFYHNAILTIEENPVPQGAEACALTIFIIYPTDVWRMLSRPRRYYCEAEDCRRSSRDCKSIH